MKRKKGRVSKRRAKIANRDKWICQLCFEKIETLRSLSVDHIIPVSKGGKNALTNMRATHNECNEIKGDWLETLAPEYYKEERKRRLENNMSHWNKIKIPAPGKSDGMVQHENNHRSYEEFRAVVIEEIKEMELDNLLNKATHFDWVKYGKSVTERANELRNKNKAA